MFGLSAAMQGPTIGGNFSDCNWPIMLAKHGVPYFHKREMADRSGPFAKWLPPQQHQQKVAEFFGDLASVIGTCRLVAFASLVRLNDLKKFNSKYNLRLQPYPLAAYGCMLMVAKEHENLTCELFFDHLEKGRFQVSHCTSLRRIRYLLRHPVR